ncbi:Brix domain-containing protein [Jimgerdemannia flammicorona]|uniref:Brix domain-containing protein n=1 Tax=Jimgerdemannia flammicorona TaxID=994334 RepID=A0A433B5Z8_9FUNG|nr:Brix domain-containing protein [Jimgerdemannia flammicorona]
MRVIGNDVNAAFAESEYYNIHVHFGTTRTCILTISRYAKQRKSHTHVAPEDHPNAGAPKSFVMRSGPVGKAVSTLVKDIRRIMEPNTASKLRERKNNKLKDFIMVAGQLGVTHFLIVSRTEAGTNLRIARVPRGPTLTFRVVTYSLARDVLALQKNPHSPGAEFHTSPLVGIGTRHALRDQHCRGFGEGGLGQPVPPNQCPNASSPSSSYTQMQLADARRIILLNYNADTQTIDFRHYAVAVRPVGISKSVKRILTTNIPNLSRFEDISEYVLREAQASESDVEDAGESTVMLPQDFVGRNNRRTEQRAIRLTELGPRIELRLIKVQNGLCGGEVLFHEFGGVGLSREDGIMSGDGHTHQRNLHTHNLLTFLSFPIPVHKTADELKQQEHDRQQRKQEAAVRRKQQEKNVERKKKEKEEHRLRTGGKPRKEGDEDEGEDQGDEGEDQGDEGEDQEDEGEDQGDDVEDDSDEDGFEMEEDEEDEEEEGMGAGRSRNGLFNEDEGSGEEKEEGEDDNDDDEIEMEENEENSIPAYKKQKINTTRVAPRADRGKNHEVGGRGAGSRGTGIRGSGSGGRGAGGRGSGGRGADGRGAGGRGAGGRGAGSRGRGAREGREGGTFGGVPDGISHSSVMPTDERLQRYEAILKPFVDLDQYERHKIRERHLNFPDPDGKLRTHLAQLGAPDRLADQLVWIPFARLEHVEKIGRGGFATVYKGTVTPLDARGFGCFLSEPKTAWDRVKKKWNKLVPDGWTILKAKPEYCETIMYAKESLIFAFKEINVSMVPEVGGP